MKKSYLLENGWEEIYGTGDGWTYFPCYSNPKLHQTVDLSRAKEIQGEWDKLSEKGGDA